MLAEKYRPQTIDDIYGQKHLVGDHGILRRIINQIKEGHNDAENVSSMIFYGPPGVGKTTSARIFAKELGLEYCALNATNAAIADIRKVVKDKEKGDDKKPVVLYLDEIQYFNKKQQQTLLPYIEDGDIILIASTTENPYHCCYDALISRCAVFEFKRLNKADIIDIVKSVVENENRDITDKGILAITENSNGDVRRSITLIETIITQYPNANHKITENDVKAILPSIRMVGFDTDGDYHYSLISALQKSIRGSDPSAAVFYLARLLEGGDIISPCRRLLVIAHEDIGLADPDACVFVKSCVDAAEVLGMPEAAKPLTNAVIRLALAPKSTTSERTYNPAAEDIKNGKGAYVPPYLRTACAKGYLYPHDYPNHWVKQQYLPDDIKDKKYYIPGDNDFEKDADDYWKNIKTWTCSHCHQDNDPKMIYCGHCGNRRND